MSTIQDVQELSREKRLEAAQYFADKIHSLYPDLSATGDVGKLPDELREAPFSHIDEIESLARVLLTIGATDDELAPHLSLALKGAGRKQFILGGAEIIALAALTLMAVQVLISKGKRTESEVISFETKGEKTIVTINRQVTYGLPGRIADILRNANDRL